MRKPKRCRGHPESLLPLIELEVDLLQADHLRRTLLHELSHFEASSLSSWLNGREEGVHSDDYSAGSRKGDHDVGLRDLVTRGWRRGCGPTRQTRDHGTPYLLEKGFNLLALDLCLGHREANRTVAFSERHGQPTYLI